MSERLNETDRFDVLGDVLETLRFRGTIFFNSELAAPWGMSLEPVGIPRFHVALSGSCYVGSNENDAVAVQEMGIIMLPTGKSHWIADQFRIFFQHIAEHFYFFRSCMPGCKSGG